MLRFIQPAQLHQTGIEISTPIQTVREGDLLRDADNMQLEQIRKLHEQGMSNRKIAEELNLSPATIGKRLKKTDDCIDKKNDCVLIIMLETMKSHRNEIE